MRALNLGQPLGGTVDAKVNWLVDAVKKIELSSREEYAESTPIKAITGLANIKNVQAALERIADLSAFLDGIFTGEANGDLLGRTGGAWTNRTLAAVLGDMLTAQGHIVRRGASAPEAYQANAANTFLGGNGTTVESRTASQVLASLSIATGSYTPTLTSVANLDATTALALRYIRIGPYVFVFGQLGTDTTAAADTATEVGISLPIASNFSSSIQLTGTGASEGNTRPARILADTTNDRARYFYLSSTTAAITHGFWFAYEIL